MPSCFGLELDVALAGFRALVQLELSREGEVKTYAIITLRIP